MKKEGAYLAVAKRKEGFSTKTTEGHKRQSKKGLKDVIQCSYSGMYAKAIVDVEKGGGKNLTKPLGHTLEIVPLEDPADLGEGGYMPVKVLYNNEPIRTELYATYVGFSTEGAWAYTTKTNKDGIGRIKMLKSGIWLIKAGHKVPYPGSTCKTVRVNNFNKLYIIASGSTWRKIRCLQSKTWRYFQTCIAL